jgi:hypothetical protein
MTEENSVTARRLYLFQQIGPLLSGENSSDVICALCDHIGMALAFVSDAPEEVEVALHQLIPDIMECVRVNWKQSRNARLQAMMQAGGPHHA